MKAVIISSIFLISCLAEAQEKPAESSAVPLYVSAASPPFYSHKLQWFDIKPEAGFISLTKLKGYLPPYGSTEIPQYVSKSALPYFSEQLCVVLCKGSMWKDSIKTADTRRNEYGKRYYFTLTRLFDQSRNETVLPKAVNALADLRFTINQQQQFELLNLLGRYCMKYRLWEEAEKFYRDALTEHLLTPDFFGYGEDALKLAEALIKQEKYSEASDWVDFAKTEFKNSGDPSGMAFCYLKEAEIALQNDSLEAAEKILLSKALLYFTRAGSDPGRMACFEKLGQVYMLQKRFSEAKWFFIQQQTLARILGDKASGFRSLIGLSQVKTAIKDYNLAAADLKRAKIFTKDDSSESILALEEAYLQLYAAQGNKKLRAQSAEKCKKLRSDVLSSQESERETAVRLLKSTQKETLLLTALQIPRTTTEGQ